MTKKTIRGVKVGDMFDEAASGLNFGHDGGPGAHLAVDAALAGERVQHIPLGCLIPDPVQPRRVLPEVLHYAYHTGEITSVQAIEQFIQMAQQTAAEQKRPWTNITALLAEDDTDDDADAEPVALTPEEEDLRDLLTLAITIRDDDQVNPLTVVDVSQGTKPLYRIETGERRFWATQLLVNFVPDYRGDGTVPCIVIPAGKASPLRQAKENTSRKGLTAIAMARQAALLIMAAHGIERPTTYVGNDFYRQALELNLHNKPEETRTILAAMGGISRGRLSQLKTLLSLSDEALALAERHKMDSYRLREVLKFPSEYQAPAVEKIVEEQLSVDGIRKLFEQVTSSDHAEDQSDTPPNGSGTPRLAASLVKWLHAGPIPDASDLAKRLLRREKNVGAIRSRLQQVRQMLDAVERELPQ